MNNNFLNDWAIQFGGQRPTFANSRVFELRGSIHSVNPRFNLVSIRFKIVPRLEALPDDADTLEQIFVLLESIVRELRNGSNQRDQVQFEISSQSLEFPIIIAFQEIEHVTVNSLLNEIEKVLQSHQDLDISDGTFTINVEHVHIPFGGGSNEANRRKHFFKTTEKMLLDKKSVITIPQETNPFCGPVALLVAKIRLTKSNFRPCNVKRKGFLKKLVKKARGLLTRAGLRHGKCGLPEIKRLAQLPEFRDFQVPVYNKAKQNLLDVQTNGKETQRIISLYYHDEHFDVITKDNAFLGHTFYCTKCNQPYKDKPHVCDTRKCIQCKDFCRPTEDALQCKLCLRYSKGQDCFNRHREFSDESSLSTCMLWKKCTQCYLDVHKDKKQEHVCYKSRCNNCHEMVDIYTHKCFIQQAKLSDNARKKRDRQMGRLLFFDVESMVELGETLNEPICVVAQCGYSGEEVVFQGLGCMDELCEWLFEHCEQNAETLTVIAHNSGAYDIFFILKWIVEHKAKIPDISFDGARVITMNTFNLYFKDSFKFWPMALSNIPSRFGLEGQKGFFPHKFNIRKNQTYVGEPPSEKYFSPELTMDEKKFKEFQTWHKEICDAYKLGSYVYDLKAEQLKYCRQDVTVLRLAGEKYRDEFIAKYDVDPWSEASTMASTCNLVYRRVFMQENTIGIIPPNGYHPKDQQSALGRLYLKFRDEVEFGGDLEYASKNGGERRICIKGLNAKVDGFDRLTNTIIQVKGCFFHGHAKCFASHTINPVKGVSMGHLFDQSQTQSQRFREANFDVFDIWECEIRDMMKNNVDGFRDWLDTEKGTMYLNEPLNGRDAFFGGRVEAFCLYAKDSEIHFYDYTSLYPYCNKNSVYPRGHPLVYTQNFHYDLNAYFGLMKCEILPPRRMYNPILPMRISVGKGVEKLMFVLCHQCAKDQNLEECTHNKTERLLRGTWGTPEIYYAVENGYRLVRIYEVWHYPDSVTGLFKEYIDTFLKVKQQSSGFPDWCTREQHKLQYIADYKEKEGIELDYQKIVKNDSERAGAKELLNNVWGFFGKKPNKPTTEIVQNASRFHEILSDESCTVTCKLINC